VLTTGKSRSQLKNAVLAGGYGTNEVGWDSNADRWGFMTGYIAESWEWPNKIEGETATFIWPT
jgi:hypothetical protein